MNAVTQRDCSVGQRLPIHDQKTHQITILATGAVRKEVILYDGRHKVMGFLFSSVGLDDAPQVLSLSFVAAKLGIYHELTDTLCSIVGEMG
jgi:hypothetical protein